LNDVVITASGLAKRYRIWTHSKPVSLSDRVSIALHRARAAEHAPAREEVWALRDVSFDVMRGEVFGVIGPNGAGKSTLLSVLARITDPTAGRAEIRGRVSSLLEVGTGFHPELSGRDNVFLNGAVLGMTRTETASKFDEIVEFSGVSEFIDMPVKRYSTGMYVRLAFSVAAHLDPEILLLDEVLAVGDRAFQEKCLRRIDEITRSGRTVLFVSHDVNSVARLCSRALVLRQGRVDFLGPVEDAIEAYLGGAPSVTATGAATTGKHSGSGEVRARVDVANAEGGTQLVAGRPVLFRVTLDADKPIRTQNLVVRLDLKSNVTGHLVAVSTQFDPDSGLHDREVLNPGSSLTCVVDELPLKAGQYSVSVTVDRLGEVLDQVDHAADFALVPSDFFGTGALPTDYHPPVLVRHRWRVVDPTGAREEVAAR
jgi:lipopolysaccharide transport system ATP-binding protein